MAIAQYQEVVRGDPASVSAHSRMGVALYSPGCVDEASVQLAKELEIALGDSTSTYNLGNIALQRANLVNALAYLNRFDEACTTGRPSPSTPAP